jgi:hypothetical protein
MGLMVTALLRPLYTRERASECIIEEAVWVPGSVWTGVKENLLPPRELQPWTVQPVASCYNGSRPLLTVNYL